MIEEAIFTVDGERCRAGSKYFEGMTFVRESDGLEVFVRFDEFDARVALVEERKD
jgi:hypothetical protein